MIIFQLIVLVIVLILEIGLLGRLASTGAAPLFSVIAVWGFTWFSERRAGLRFALLAGLTLDVVSFLPFGTWLISLMSVSLLTDWLKTRFFEVSSLALSLTTLAASSLVNSVIISLVSRSFDYTFVAIEVFINLLGGIVIYYVLAFRFRFNQRWTGRRL